MADTPPRITPPTLEHPAHAPTDDVAISRIIWVGIGLAVIGLIGLVASWVLLSRFDTAALRTFSSASPMTPHDPPPAPRLQPQPRELLAVFQEQAAAQLHGYRWVDREQQVVQIPIEQAIELLAERGFPTPVAPPVEQPASKSEESR